MQQLRHGGREPFWDLSVGGGFDYDGEAGKLARAHSESVLSEDQIDRVAVAEPSGGLEW
jgi:hypothetical protein